MHTVRGRGVVRPPPAAGQSTVNEGARFTGRAPHGDNTARAVVGAVEGHRMMLCDMRGDMMTGVLYDGIPCGGM